MVKKNKAITILLLVLSFIAVCCSCIARQPPASSSSPEASAMKTDTGANVKLDDLNAQFEAAIGQYEQQHPGKLREMGITMGRAVIDMDKKTFTVPMFSLTEEKEKFVRAIWDSPFLSFNNVDPGDGSIIYSLTQ